MLRHSSFVSENSRARSAGEIKYYIIYAAVLFLCGLLLLIIPVFDRNGAFILAAGWALLAVFALDILRPMFYSRGVADIVMAILTGAFYALLGFVLGMNALSIENYRIAVCLALFFAGISRVLAFARMVVVTNLPLMLICGFAEMIASFLLFMGWPGDSAPMIYWFVGMTVILTSFESISEAAKLRQER
jgi:hypothetical protein